MLRELNRLIRFNVSASQRLQHLQVLNDRVQVDDFLHLPLPRLQKVFWRIVPTERLEEDLLI